MNQQRAWRSLLQYVARGEGPASPAVRASDGKTTLGAGDLFQKDLYEGADESTRWLVDLYAPLCRRPKERFVVGHLGQSLDGRIAAANGKSRWITCEEDVTHNHRMRALFDAVVVGAGTVAHDNPQLTVREVEGRHPVRVVIDTRRRLDAGYTLFQDGEAPTWLLCDQACCEGEASLGKARIIGLPLLHDHLDLPAMLDLLAKEGLTRIFVEGGGVTVSRFLAAGCLHRLQLTVAPLILGSGRPSITLPEIEAINAALTPSVRRFSLGRDVLFECCFDG